MNQFAATNGESETATRAALKAASRLSRGCVRGPRLFPTALLLIALLASCGKTGPGEKKEGLSRGSDWRLRGVRAVLDDADSNVKSDALFRLAFDGGTNANYTNPADIDGPPDRRFHDRDFVAELSELATGESALAAPALRALSAFKLDQSDLQVIASQANPAQIIRRSIVGGTYKPDPVQGEKYIAALYVLAAQGEQAQDATKELAKVLEAKPPGLDEVSGADRKRVMVDWEDYQADAAQTLLATKGNVTPYVNRILELWARTNSQDHVLAQVEPTHIPHVPLIDACALGALKPELAGRFAELIESEQRDPKGFSTFLLEDALKGLACTGSSDKKHRELVASVFASPRSSAVEEGNPKHWRMFRPESLKSIAAVALIRMGAAGEDGLPSMREALEGVDKNVEASWLPGRQGLQQMTPDSRDRLKQAALEMLDSGEEHARSVAARVLVNLLLAVSLAGDSDQDVRAKLFEAAGKRGDAESLRAVLLIAHTKDVAPDYEERVKNLFLELLRSGDVPGRKNAVRALGGLQLKDESTHIRRNAVYVPIPLRVVYKRAFAPVLADIFKSAAAQNAKEASLKSLENKLEALKALGYTREVAASYLQDIVATERPEPDGSVQAALEAAVKAGPFELPGVCRLLESSFEGAPPEAARSGAYYVSNGDEVATRLIAALGQGEAAPNSTMTATRARERLDAFDVTLEQCKGLPKLKNEIGRLSVGLARRARDADDKNLISRLASKLSDTPYVAQISEAGGLNETGQSRWNWRYVIGIPVGLLVLGVILYKRHKVLQWLNKISTRIPSWVKVKILGMDVPVGEALGAFVNPPSDEDLDEWVAEHVGKAQRSYVSVCDRSDSFDGELELNGKRLSSLRPADLHDIFSMNQIRLLVTGEDGAAGARLACLLGWWSMKEAAGDRPCSEHRMLPVLINDRVHLEDDEGAFLKVLDERLQAITDLSDGVPRNRLLPLLMRRRVLVIVVGFAQMDETQRQLVLDGVRDSQAYACVISSTSIDVWDGLPKHVIRLARRTA